MRIATTLVTVLLLALGPLGCANHLGSVGDDDDDDDVIHPDGGPGDDEFNGADAEICDQVTPIEITGTPPPDLMLVVDKSGSMADPLSGGGQKWAVMRDALMTIVNNYQGGINFGLILFPLGSQCSAGIVSANMGSDASTLSTQLALTFPDGGTPTHLTLQNTLAYYNSIPVNPQGRYVLLATDGMPNCRDMVDPNDPTTTETLAAVTSLAGAGISTFVLGFGDAVNADPTFLQSMAAAGGTGNYYAANSPDELAAALDAIAGSISVPECTFTLAEVPEDADRLAVFFDDVPVPRDTSHATGWDYDPLTNSISFYGGTCDQLQSGSVSSVRVDWGCGGPIVN